MRITIAERLRPFSHLPGIRLLLPGSSLEIQVFPARLIIRDLSGPIPQLVDEICLNVKGAVEKFTVIQDLERGAVSVSGQSPEGYFRYHLVGQPNRVKIYIEKVPSGGLTFSPSNHLDILSVKESQAAVNLPRLSLGNHKAQDWELVCRRNAMEEIFPSWYRLGQWLPQTEKASHPLLEQCELAIGQNAPEKIVPLFRSLFKAGFQGILSPTLRDENYLGFDLPEPNQGSSLYLLKHGAGLIQSLFVKKNRILPALPPEFHAGRLLNVPFCDAGFLDIEWSKKTIRQMIFRSSLSTEKEFLFPNEIKRFRLRHSEADRGQIIPVGQSIKIEPSHHYFFDNFQC